MKHIRIIGKPIKASICTKSICSIMSFLIADIIESPTRMLNPDAYKLVTYRRQVGEYQNKSVCRADLEINPIRLVKRASSARQ